MQFRFAHRFAAQRYVVKPMRPIYANDGSGQIVDNAPGEAIEFVNHEFVTEDPKVADWLRSQPGFGVECVEVAPGDVLPTRVVAPQVEEALNTGNARTAKEEEYRCHNCGRVFRGKAGKVSWTNHVPACIKKSQAEAKKESSEKGGPAPEQPVTTEPASPDSAQPQ